MAAIGALGTGVLGASGDNTPLSSTDVRRRLASESPAPAPVDPSESTELPAPSGGASAAGVSPMDAPEPVTRALATPGGTVHASCADGLATLTAWSPAQGFRV